MCQTLGVGTVSPDGPVCLLLHVSHCLYNRAEALGCERHRPLEPQAPKDRCPSGDPRDFVPTRAINGVCVVSCWSMGSLYRSEKPSDGSLTFVRYIKKAKCWSVGRTARVLESYPSVQAGRFCPDMKAAIGDRPM